MTDRAQLLDESTDTYQVSPTESLSQGVVAAVAEAAGVEPVATAGTGQEQVLAPLYDAIDPDALDDLFRADTTGRVTFTYGGYLVTVDSSGYVTVECDETVTDRVSN